VKQRFRSFTNIIGKKPKRLMTLLDLDVFCAKAMRFGRLRHLRQHSSLTTGFVLM